MKKKNIIFISIIIVVCLIMGSSINVFGVFEYDDIYYKDKMDEVIVIDNFETEYCLQESKAKISHYINSLSLNYEIFGYSEFDLNEVSVVGPYKVYVATDNNVIEVNAVNYHVLYSGIAKGVISIYYTDEGILSSKYGAGYSKKLNSINNENNEFYLVADDNIIRAVFEDNSSIVLEDYSIGFENKSYVNNEDNSKLDIISEEQYFEQDVISSKEEKNIESNAQDVKKTTINDIDEEILQKKAKEIEQMLLKEVELPEKEIEYTETEIEIGYLDIINVISTKEVFMKDRNQIGIVDIDKIKSATASSGVAIVYVAQVNQEYSGINYPCHEACIAAVAKTREPVKYGTLRVIDVYQSTTQTFHDLTYDRASRIKTVLKGLYLDNGNSSHYTLDFSVSLSRSSYESIINNECLILAIATTSNGTQYHATVMCGYDTYGSNKYVYMMDPFTQQTEYVEWSGTYFSYNFSNKNLSLADFVISYY